MPQAYEFRLVFRLPDHVEKSRSYLDALFESGCDDALVGVGIPGMIGLNFTRTADGIDLAIRSAIEGVRKAIPDAELISADTDLPASGNAG